MSAPSYQLLYTDEADALLNDLRRKAQYREKLKKIRKALRLLQERGPRYPGLNSHLYQSIKSPGGEDVWESYVENHTPRVWRIWWIYGPQAGTITIVTIGPHP